MWGEGRKGYPACWGSAGDPRIPSPPEGGGDFDFSRAWWLARVLFYATDEFAGRNFRSERVVSMGVLSLWCVKLSVLGIGRMITRRQGEDAVCFELAESA